MTKFLLVMLGGGLGAVTRYAVSLLAARVLGVAFPWGTLFANLSGCFLIGLFFGLLGRSSLATPITQVFFVTGFLGGLTTFSSYAIESVNAILTGLNPVAVMNILANNVAGLAFALLGIWVGRLR